MLEDDALIPEFSNRALSDANADESKYQEVLTDLAARREELAITIHDLTVSKPSTVVSFLGLQIALLFLIVALIIAVVPYFQSSFPHQVSTVAAFLAVIFAFAAYLSFRKFSIEHEQRRLFKNLIRRAEYLEGIADKILSGQSAGQPGGSRHGR